MAKPTPRVRVRLSSNHSGSFAPHAVVSLFGRGCEIEVVDDAGKWPCPALGAPHSCGSRRLPCLWQLSTAEALGSVGGQAPFILFTALTRASKHIDLHVDDVQLTVLPLALRLDDGLIRAIIDFVAGMDREAAGAAAPVGDIPSLLRVIRPAPRPTRLHARIRAQAQRVATRLSGFAVGAVSGTVGFVGMAAGTVFESAGGVLDAVWARASERWTTIRCRRCGRLRRRPAVRWRGSARALA